MTFRKDGNKNQIVKNINYDQNSLTIFWKPLITKSKGYQIKFTLRRLTGALCNKMWDFSSTRLGNKSSRNEQKRQKFIGILLFIKKVLNSNLLETLRIEGNHWESLLYPYRERLRPFIIQDMSYDYKKNEKYRQNLQEKSCTKTMSPQSLNIKVITKNNKSLRLHFLQVTTFVIQMKPIIVILWKETKHLQKRGNFAKITKFGVMKTGFSKKKRPFEENTVMKRQLFFKR